MGVRDVAPGVEILRNARIPTYAFPEDGVRSLAAANNLVSMHETPRRHVRHFDDVDVELAKRVIAEGLGDRKEKYLTHAQCRPILEAYRLPLLKSGVAQTVEEAATLAESIAAPVAMKVMSADVVHKWDAGGVILNVVGPVEARTAYARIERNVLAAVPNAKIEGILIEQMAPKGVEVIVGSSRDPQFGPLMMFGLGGTMVELLKDVSFRLAPMWQISAERMVREIRSFKILDGFRGAPPCDVQAIVETLLRLSAMVCNHPEISELDINPLIVHVQGQGCSVADSRIMLRRVTGASATGC
jgi:acetate---CoA ligase (ADP-forming)